ncbi:MAG: polymer-forming cytoskeletal protein [Pseudomonadota bacterium]
MFSKAKEKTGAEQKQAPAALDAGQATANASSGNAKRGSGAKPSGVPSLISSDVSMTGNILAAGEVQFDGMLEGDIRAATLIVGEQATVKGEVVCERVTVRGRVEGGIRAKQVSLAATAHILGDIVHSSLSVENGAHFEGACRHSDDPLSDAASRDFRKQRPMQPTPAAPSAPASDNDAGEQPAQAVNGAAKTTDTPSFLTPNRSPLR